MSASPSAAAQAPFSIRLAGGLVMRGWRIAGGDKTPALCLHGLTRNARDFEDVAPLIAATGRDAIALSFRGRGASDRDPEWRNYRPVIYRDDVLAAMNQLGLSRAVFLGTSLGGIVSMLIAETVPDMIAGVVLNDIGPMIAPEGVARIMGYVGQSGDAHSLDEAARRARAINEVAFPGRDEAFWRAFARRLYRETPEGTWRLDYDPAITRALAEAGPAPDLWPGFRALADKPTLVLRGETSDLLSAEIVGVMKEANPRMNVCEVKGVGHAPLLTEPDAAAALADFLASID